MEGLDCASWKTSSYSHRRRRLLHGYRGAHHAAQRPRNRHQSHPWRNILEIVHHRRQSEAGETDRSYYALDHETCCLLPGMPVEIGEATGSHESPALNEHRVAALVPYDIVRPSGTRVLESRSSKHGFFTNDPTRIHCRAEQGQRSLAGSCDRSGSRNESKPRAT